MLARPMSDRRRIYAVQGIRAFVYGFGSVLLGASLARSGLSGAQVGLVFAAMLAGSALASLTLAARADRLGRRRVYLVLLGAMGAAGSVFALTESVPLLVLAALTGVVSVDVIEAGPLTSVEQGMLPQVAGSDAPRAFGAYNAIAAVVGSAGALAAGGPELLRGAFPALPPSQRWLLVYPVASVAALAVASRLSPAVEAPGRAVGLPASTAMRPRGTSGSVPRRRALEASRGPVLRLAGLFALDSFAGGFIVQSFIVYWFTEQLGAPTFLMGATLAAAGLAQTASFVAAPRLAARIGLLNTMVFTHLPSNVLLMLIPFAPSLGWALALLVARFALSQMDVPTRQAYLAALAGPEERAAAAALTNAARTVVRPIAPPIAGTVVGTAAGGAPFLLAGGLKAVYDVLLFVWFRGVPVGGEARREDVAGAGAARTPADPVLGAPPGEVSPPRRPG